MRSLRYQLEPVSSQCKDTQEQHIQGLGLQGAQRNKDIPVVLDPHLQVKALTDQELLLRVKAIQEPENLLPDPRDIQGLGLHLDNKELRCSSSSTETYTFKYSNSSMKLVGQIDSKELRKVRVNGN